jgi:hypothetical protein
MDMAVGALALDESGNSNRKSISRRFGVTEFA